MMVAIRLRAPTMLGAAVLLLASVLLAIATAPRALAYTVTNTYTASAGFSPTTQGPDWFYQERTADCGSCYSNMTAGSGGSWNGADGGSIQGDRMGPGSGHDAVRTWAVPRTGTVDITGRSFKLNPHKNHPSVQVSVELSPGGTVLWSKTIASDDFLGYRMDSVPALTNLAVSPGQYIQFVVSQDSTGYAADEIGWDPTISYVPSALVTNTSYYVDASSGRDSNTGTSPGAAFQTVAPLNDIRYFGAGVRILFAQGETFTGGLNVQLTGTAAAPDEIGSFAGSAGAGAKPVLTDVPGYDHTDIVQLGNSQHFTVDNLVFRGTQGANYNTANFVPANSAGGLSVYSTRSSGGQLSGIVVNNCEFYNSQSGAYFDDMGWGDATAPEGFDQVTVENSVFNSVWQIGTIMVGYNAYASGPVNQNTNITVKDNQFYNIFGSPTNRDGASAASVTNATGIDIESNVASNIGGWQAPPETGSIGGTTALGVANARNFVIQKNEVVQTRTAAFPAHGGFVAEDFDASAIDADQDSQNGEIAFNLTYGNLGPSIELGSFGIKTTENIAIHHNISINDVRGVASTSQQGAIRFWGGLTQIQVFNNTVYVDSTGTMGEPSCVSFEQGGTTTDVTVADNIFKTTNGTPMIRAVTPDHNASTHIDSSNKFIANLYDSSGASLVISNDDTRGDPYANVTSLPDWQRDGQESYSGTPEGVVADAGFTNLPGFSPPHPYLPGSPVSSMTNFDLTSGSAARGQAIDPWPTVTLTAPMAAQQLDFHLNNAATVTDIGAAP